MDYLFAIKKLLGQLLSPMPIILFLLIYVSWQFNRSQVKAKWGLWIVTLVFFLSSSPIVSNFLIKSIEETYPVYNDHLSHVDNIVVLGCYNREDETRPFLDNLHACSLTRLVEAIRLSKIYPQAKIVLSGGDLGKGKQLTHANYQQLALIQLGIAEETIVTVSGSQDTNDESVKLSPILAGKVNLLVTEAVHMKRAMTLFEQQGLAMTAVPARYFSSNEMEMSAYLFVPSAQAMLTTKRYVYEVIGNFWVELKILLSR